MPPMLASVRFEASFLSPPLSHSLSSLSQLLFVEKDVITPYTFCFAPLAAEMLKNVE